MIYDVRYNNVSIKDASGAIQVVDVSEITPKEKVTTVAAGLSHGTRLLRRIRESLTVTMTFVIREKDLAARAAAYDRVLQWAGGAGWLSISDRPEQMLYIDIAEFPTMGSAKGWAGEITANFTAYSRPFFESAFPAIASVTTASKSASVSILPPGNAEECLLEAEIKAGATCNTLTIQTGKSTISFASLGLSNGQTLTVGHTDDGLLQMKIGETSVMAKRTEDSSDDLLATPGQTNTVKFTSSGACTATFSTRGRWR